MALTLKSKYPLKHLLHTLQLAKSVFYYQAQTRKRPNSYERELRLIKSIYHEHKGRYGYRRIHLELKNQGFMLNHKTVQRLMAQLNLKSTVRIKKYRSYRGESGTAAPNVLERDFSATQPDEKWVTDVTEFKVKEQKVYLSPVVDLFTQEVVAYRVAKNACLPLVNLKSTVRIKKYRSYRGESGTAAPNVLERDFSATQPDEKWVTDVTEFKVKEQKVYLSPVVDLFTQEVVAYRVAKNACLPLVTDMLTEAISKLKPNSKPIIHSDQGWQYRHRQYQKKVAESGLTQSMSRKGNCLDNAVAENFFALLKTEMYHNQSFEDADALIEQIKEYIEYYNTKRIKVSRKGNCLDNAVAENFFALLKTEMYHNQSFEDADALIEQIKEYIEYYNTKRIKVKLKGLTPIEYRTQALKAA
ncbi:IS3 family transposase [Vibrio sp. Isolate22]